MEMCWSFCCVRIATREQVNLNVLQELKWEDYSFNRESSGNCLGLSRNNFPGKGKYFRCTSIVIGPLENRIARKLLTIVS